jgi:hypothetical protein
MDRIGLWAKGPGWTRWHLIESEMGLDVESRCGRRLHPPMVAMPIRTHDTSLELCFYCDERHIHRPTLNTRGPAA